MTWQILQMPEQPVEIARWLDRQLVGLHLRELASELAGIHPEKSKKTSADEILGERKTEFLRRGSTALTQNQLEQILTNSDMLFELQEIVFEAGGTYWYDLQAGDATLQSHINRGRERAESIVPVISPQQPAVTRSRLPPRQRWYSNPTLASLATAATLLLAFSALEWFRSPAEMVPAVAWGWAKPDALPTNVSAKEYFNSLADSADAWFNKRPDNAIDLARRIAELRQGCTVLLLADNKPLDNQQRQWLRTKCRDWAAKFDESLAELESGENALEVRNRMDGAIKSLEAALREQANAA